MVGRHKAIYRLDNGVCRTTVVLHFDGGTSACSASPGPPSLDALSCEESSAVQFQSVYLEQKMYNWDYTNSNDSDGGGDKKQYVLRLCAFLKQCTKSIWYIPTFSNDMAKRV